MNWEQLKAIVWLRWRLTRNRFARAGALNTVLSIFMLALLVVGGAAAGVGGFLAGLFALPKLPPMMMLLVWDVAIFIFLCIWLAGLMVEIQRSESVDLTKMLHLPVTLRQVFVFNYAISHFTPAIVLLVPGMLGAAAGLAFGADARMAWLIPLVLSFIFMLSAWTYCLRGWLVALMVNKRRRRAVIMWITVAFVLLAQLPNLLLNRGFLPRDKAKRPQTAQTSQHGTPGRRDFELPEGVLEAHLALPPGWVGYGAMAARQQNIWPALAGVVAGGLIGMLGLMRAYKATVRFYQGAEEKPKAKTPRKPAAREAGGRLLVERSLPWLPDDTAGLTLATLRSLMRSPELKMALIVPVVMLLVFGSMQLTRARPAGTYMPPLAAAGAAMLATFSLIQTMSNVFGLDRNGFRALVLLPVPRHRILLAKNLALFPFAAGIGLGLLILAAFLFRMRLSVFMAGLLQIPAAFLLFSLVGNVSSVVVPYRVAPGTLQAKKPKAVVILSVFVTMLIMPVVMAPVILPGLLEILFSVTGWVTWLPVNLLASIVLVVGVVLLYWVALPAQGRLLQQREQRILQEVTEELE